MIISIEIMLWKDVYSNTKNASLFYSCTYFVSRIMKINGKNDYFYRNYVLERSKDVNSNKKDASIFYSYLYIFLHTKHFSSVIRALFYIDYAFFPYSKPLFGRIYISPLTSNMNISLIQYCVS